MNASSRQQVPNRSVRNEIGEWPNRNGSDTTFRTDGSIWPVASLARGYRVGSATSREDIGSWQVRRSAAHAIAGCPRRRRLGSKKPPVPPERERTLQRKRVELARVRASFARPGLSAGLFAALKAQERTLLQEIAELE
jgi:hypothetical protein